MKHVECSLNSCTHNAYIHTYIKIYTNDAYLRIQRLHPYFVPRKQFTAHGTASAEGGVMQRAAGAAPCGVLRLFRFFYPFAPAPRLRLLIRRLGGGSMDIVRGVQQMLFRDASVEGGGSYGEVCISTTNIRKVKSRKLPIS